MSADSYAVCPRCFFRNKQDFDAIHAEWKAKVDEGYGDMSVDDFMALMASEPKAENFNLVYEDAEKTVREDYEQGLSDHEDKFFTTYMGSCEKKGVRLQASPQGRPCSGDEGGIRLSQRRGKGRGL